MYYYFGIFQIKNIKISYFKNNRLIISMSQDTFITPALEKK